MITKDKELYQGKAKIIYSTSDPKYYWVSYKDSLTAFNGLKTTQELGKGALNNTISSYIFSYLKENGVETHFVNQISENEMLVKKVKILPLEVVVRNIAAGSICKRLGFQEKTPFSSPILEFYFKDDSLGDPLLNESHIEIMGLATKEQVERLKIEALKINQLLKTYFHKIGLSLVDFKLEFGLDENNTIILADEISPDTCRLWDLKTGESLDKDIFRQGKGNVLSGYTQVINRIKERFSKMKFNVEVIVEFRKGILDPQSQAIQGAIASLGYDNVTKLKVGKKFNFIIEESNKEDASQKVEELCKKLLANPVIENYHYTIGEDK